MPQFPIWQLRAGDRSVNLSPALSQRVGRTPCVKGLSRHILALRAPVFHAPLDPCLSASPPSVRAVPQQLVVVRHHVHHAGDCLVA